MASYVGQRSPAVSGDGTVVVVTSDARPSDPVSDAVSGAPSDAPPEGAPDDVLDREAQWTEMVTPAPLDDPSAIGAAVTQLVRWVRNPGDDAEGLAVHVISLGPGAPGNSSSGEASVSPR
ncbi:MAG: hypothetical protein R2705_07450 [Ilumatobacteraceae bacterium]